MKLQPDFVAPVREEEKREVGTVSPAIYVKYFWTGGGCLGIFLFILLNVLAQGAYLSTDWWLAYW